MSDNKVEFELAMKDEATRVINNFKANVSTQSKAVQDAFQKMQGATAGSTNALMNFNRVIQDAPYGIIGVANNLNPLFESFQRLTKETGSVKSALSSMLATLASPAGIGVAIAAVSSLAVVFGKDLFGGIEASEKKLNDLKLEAIDLKVKLGDLTKAQGANAWNEELTKAEVELHKMKSLTTDWAASISSQFRYGLIQKVVGTPEQIQQAENNILAIRDKVQTFYKEIQKEFDKANPRLEMNADQMNLPDRDTFEKALAEYRKHNLAKAEQDWKIFWDNEKRKLAIEKSIIDARDQQAEEFFQREKDRAQQTAQIMFSVYSALGAGIRGAFENTDTTLKGVMKNILNTVITTVEGLMTAAAAAGSAFGIITFGGSLAKDIPLLAAGFTALEGARAIVNKLHNGGTVGNFQNQPASREFPIMVRGGETVRTEGQERDLQNNMRRGGKGGTVLNVNFNSPVSDTQFVLSALKKVIRETGLTVDKVVVDNRSKISLA